MTPRAEVIAVVGGGASGVLAAIHLLRDAPVPVRILIIEPRGELGRGIAYGTDDLGHLLNVRAGCLSALPDQPDHFTAWAGRGRSQVNGESFLPRAWYGVYLRSLLEPVEHVPASVTSVSAAGSRVEIHLSDGGRRTVDRVVLAPGSSPPSWPGSLGGPGDRWIDDPWSPDAFEVADPEQPVLLVGTGLTAVDAALSLHAAGHRRIVATSRHGLLPAAHPEHPDPPLPIEPPSRPTARSLFAWARATAEEAGGWGRVVDALRPQTDSLWGAMTADERVRLLRHVQRRWETQRHRMAPTVARRIESMLASGQLTVVPGGVRCAHEAPGAIQAVVGDHLVRFGAVVNCTGPTALVRQSSNPLVRNLLARRVVRPGPLGFGFDTDEAGCVPGSGRTLWLLGPLRRGRRWETTAIPEIRNQATSLPGALWRMEAMVSA